MSRKIKMVGTLSSVYEYAVYDYDTEELLGYSDDGQDWHYYPDGVLVPIEPEIEVVEVDTLAWD